MFPSKCNSRVNPRLQIRISHTKPIKTKEFRHTRSRRMIIQQRESNHPVSTFTGYQLPNVNTYHKTNFTVRVLCYTIIESIAHAHRAAHAHHARATRRARGHLIRETFNFICSYLKKNAMQDLCNPTIQPQRSCLISATTTRSFDPATPKRKFNYLAKAVTPVPISINKYANAQLAI